METQHTFRRAREAARALNRTASERIDRLLLALADAVEAGTEELLAANARDRSRMNPADPAYDRLLLDSGRLLGIAADAYWELDTGFRRCDGLQEQRARWFLLPFA